MTAVRVLALLMVGLLAGCTSAPKVPTVTFEAEGFLRRYMAQRDQFVRRTAPAHAKCETVTPASPIDVRNKCEKLADEEKNWADQDAVVMTAILAGQVIKSVDLEKAAELLLKVAATAADIAL